MSTVSNIKRKIGGYWLVPEIMPQQFVPKTANYTILAPADYGKLFTNAGAAGAVTFTLPSPKEGLLIRFVKVVKAQNLAISRSGTAVIRGIGGQGNTLTNSTATEHGSVTLQSDGVDWYIVAKEGTWAGLA